MAWEFVVQNEAAAARAAAAPQLKSVRPRCQPAAPEFLPTSTVRQLNTVQLYNVLLTRTVQQQVSYGKLTAVVITLKLTAPLLLHTDKVTSCRFDASNCNEEALTVPVCLT